VAWSALGAALKWGLGRAWQLSGRPGGLSWRPGGFAWRPGSCSWRTKTKKHILFDGLSAAFPKKLSKVWSTDHMPLNHRTTAIVVFHPSTGRRLMQAGWPAGRLLTQAGPGHPHRRLRNGGWAGPGLQAAKKPGWAGPLRNTAQINAERCLVSYGYSCGELHAVSKILQLQPNSRIPCMANRMDGLLFIIDFLTTLCYLISHSTFYFRYCYVMESHQVVSDSKVNTGTQKQLPG